MFPRHNGTALISEFFALNLRISVPLTNKYLLHYHESLNNFFVIFSNINRILFFSTVNVPSYPCVGSPPRIKTSFFLLSTCTEVLKSTPKIIRFLPNPLSTEKSPFLLNLIPYTKYLFKSISLLLQTTIFCM